MAKWIWLNEKYKAKEQGSREYCVGEFVALAEIKKEATLKICADTRYELYINGALALRGPSATGHDFIPCKMTYSYFDEITVKNTGRVEFKVLVASTPAVLNEYSFGVPGLYFELTEDNATILESDENWRSRLIKARKTPCEYDFTVTEDEYSSSSLCEDVHTLERNQIEALVEERITPKNFAPVTVCPKETVKISLDFDKIYSAYTNIEIDCSDFVRVTVKTAEHNGICPFYDEITLNKSITLLGSRLKSVGEVEITVENQGEREALLKDFYLLYSHYPVKNKAYFKSSSPLLNKIYDVCMHTLEICRQNTHLDSPTHQEPLACTGDYLIQAQMEYINIYDPTLTRFDIVRTANFLKAQGGKMFHTSYSLMVPMWIYDYYVHTGDKTLIYETKEALECLFSLFKSYISKDNGLIEYAPNYMFVDWIVMKDAKDPYGDARDMMSHGKTDGFSLHHPPKVLGQSVLCMCYYKALETGALLFEIIEENSLARECKEIAEGIKENINNHLYDSERGLYIGGLPTPDMVKPNEWLPENIQRTFYLKQANTLAVLYGIAPKEKREFILDYVAADLRKEEMQPYFYHFLLEALYNEGLFQKYGMPLINRYESLIERCEKGLSEAWEYINCDLSHAWGGTPAYILKKAISGFEMVENNYKKARLNPNLFGLDFASFNISTPYGDIEIELEKDKAPKIKAPQEIEIV